jgi:hypothetical protein
MCKHKQNFANSELEIQLQKFGGSQAHFCSGGRFAEAQTSLLV